VDEKRVVIAIQDNSKSGGHGLGSNVDLAVFVGRDVDLVMANVVLVHEGDVIFGQRLRDQGAGWHVRKGEFVHRVLRRTEWF
jgi:hypothetical protein